VLTRANIAEYFSRLFDYCFSRLFDFCIHVLPTSYALYVAEIVCDESRNMDGGGGDKFAKM
jgi:hypothetical protein